MCLSDSIEGTCCVAASSSVAAVEAQAFRISKDGADLRVGSGFDAAKLKLLG